MATRTDAGDVFICTGYQADAGQFIAIKTPSGAEAAHLP